MSEEQFNIPKEVDSLEAVPEALRGFYGEADGKYVLEDVTSLRNSMKNAKRERDEARTKAKAVEQWERIGKSPDEIAELLADRERQELAKAEKAGEWDKLRAQMNDKHQAELKALREELDMTRKSQQQYIFNAEATAAIAAANGNTKLLLPLIRDHVKVEYEDGRAVTRVVDSKGERRVNANGEDMSIADLVAEMRQSDDYAQAFKASGQSGSGAPANRTSGGAGGQVKRRSEMNFEEKAAFIQANGQDGYLKLPA
jgi:hypothetical protein